MGPRGPSGPSGKPGDDVSVCRNFIKLLICYQQAETLTKLIHSEAYLVDFLILIICSTSSL